MKKIILLLFLVTIQANSQTNFTGAFAAANWTLSNTNANGFVETANAPNFIQLTGGNTESNTPGDTDFTIVCPTSTTISFDWAYSTLDGGPQYDFPSLTINGVKSFFTGFDMSAGQAPQSGSMTVNVSAGEIFGFNVYSSDNLMGAATITISNFNFGGGTVVPTSKIRANQCGTTLATVSSNIAADYVPGYQTYRFEVTRGSTVNTVDLNKYNFSLTKTPGIIYGATYGVRVAVKTNGVWGPYGASCDISTPVAAINTIPTTKIKSTICGTTLATISSKIAANPVYAAEGYRFEIITGGVPTVYDSNFYNFKLSQSGAAVAFNTVYSIRVAAKVNGVYGEYGASCDVTTPSNAGFARTIIASTAFNIAAYPNPSNSDFKLQFTGANEDAVSILVFDMTGRQIENKEVNASAIENITIGQNYSAGIYNVIVSQGKNTKTVRLVKN